jgi:general secretion pathway protein G
MRQAFTLLELVFALVIVAILVGIAVPKLSATRDDAIISKGKATLATVRSAIAIERQRRLLLGDRTDVTSLAYETPHQVFSKFNRDKNGEGESREVLSYPLKRGTDVGEWGTNGTDTYTFYYSGGHCNFTLEGNKLLGECAPFNY